MVLAALVIGASLLSLIALARAGIQIWWGEPDRVLPTIRVGEAVPVAVLLLGLLILTFTVEGPLGFLQRTADQLLQPAQYIESVLGSGGRT